MITVDTYLESSNGKGIGLFAKNIIPKGTIWWIRNENFDRVISEQELATYDDFLILFVTMYGCLEPTGNWYLCVDNSRFTNHSNTPNSSNNFNELGETISCIANKDIAPGEEILCDYREICLSCKNDLGFKNDE
jgi:SET domain-containing protein